MSTITLKPIVIGFYINKIRMFDIKAGAIWALVEYDDLEPNIGNPAHGALVYCWTKDGDCQQDWCGGTFILPGQYAESKYFEETEIEGRVPKYIIPKVNTTVNINGKNIELEINDYITLRDKYNV